MEDPAHSKPSKDKAHPWGPIIILWVLRTSPHQTYLLKWQIQSQTGEVVWQTQGTHALNTWWPTLTPDFCQLAAGLDSWDIADADHTQLTKTMEPTSGGQGMEGCSSPRRRCVLAGAQFYVCPKDGRTKSQAYKCGGYEKMFCAAWGCETTGDAWWAPTSSWDKIKVSRGWVKPPIAWWPNNYQGRCADGGGTSWGQFKCENSTCLPLRIDFTEKGKTATEWRTGYTWGLQWYKIGRGITFKIKLIAETQTQPIGPNPFLPLVKTSTQQGRDPPARPPANTTIGNTPGNSSQTPGTGDRLLDLVQGAYLTLNYTDPNKTQECWLCLISRPPYYEGIAVLGNYSNHTSAPQRCAGPSQHKLTLSEVSGRGLCVGVVPPTHQALCNTTQNITGGSYYLEAQWNLLGM